MKFITPKEYWIFLFFVFFKGRTLSSEKFNDSTELHTRFSKVFINLQVGFYNLIWVSIFVIILEFIFLKIGILYNLNKALEGVVVGVVLGVMMGIGGADSWGVVVGVVGAISWGIGFGFEGGVAGSITLGVTFGVTFAIIMGVFLDVTMGSVMGIIFGIGFGIFRGFATSVTLDIKTGISWGFAAGGGWILSYLFVWSRWFYLPVYLLSIYFKNIKIKNLPFHWDENIGAPLPFLKFTLLRLAVKNKQAVIEEAIFLIRERPPQRKKAQSVLVQLAADEMVQFRNIKNIANLKKELDFLPDESDILPGYFTNSLQAISQYAADAQKCLYERNITNRIRMLQRLREDILSYQKQLDFAPSKQGLLFGKVITCWIEIVKKEIETLKIQSGRPLPNPFKVGGPLEPDSEMFIGREDIIQHIQQEALREGGPGAILFMGNRRTGKTSTLKNLHRYFLSNFIPVYIDCQGAFDLSHFLKQIYKGIIERQLPKTLQADSKISLGDFTDYLKDLERDLQEKNQYLLLCFDEYERLSEKVTDSEFKDVPNALRHWIQHLTHIFCLFAGAHPVENLQPVDWTDYLINVRLVRISYLDQDSALKLVTAPIPDFGLEYESPDLASSLVKRLGRQPFLLQATMSELVNYLNSMNQKKAKQSDINLAIQKMLSSADVYFSHIWEKDSTEQERQVMLAVSKGQNLPASSGSAIKSLIKKEILFLNKDQYQFCVPVLMEWILQHI